MVIRAQVEMALERRSRVWRVGESGFGGVWRLGGEVRVLDFRWRVCRFGRVGRRCEREVRDWMLLLDRSSVWRVAGRGVCVGQAVWLLCDRMRVEREGRAAAADAVSAGVRSVDSRLRWWTLGSCSVWVGSEGQVKRLPSKVREMSFGKSWQRAMISSHVSKRLPPRSKDVMFAHSEATA